MIDHKFSAPEIERVDDVPLLQALLQQMEVDRLLDQYYPTHGNWAGELSFGQVAMTWLTFILSQADHRLLHVEPWAAGQLHLLEGCLGKPVRALDFSDDRLAAMLTSLGDEEVWGQFESALNTTLLRVYDLRPERVRLDMTTAPTYASAGDGLVKFGQSKTHRRDLAQVKISLSTLDPLGLPLVTRVVSGNAADDPLYLPQIKQVQAQLGCGGKTYIGDCKIGSLATRAYLAAHGDYYLHPMSQTQLQATPLEGLLAPVFSGEQELKVVLHPETKEMLGVGFQLQMPMRVKLDGHWVSWIERRLLIRSSVWAEQQADKLAGGLAKAMAALDRLTERKRGRKRLTEDELKAAAEKLMTDAALRGVLRYELQGSGKETSLRYWIDQTALTEAQARMGWRVYATNQRQLTLSQAVAAYREQYRIERGFHRLKGQPLGLTPFLVSDERRLCGLTHLLTIGLRLLCLMEFTARQALAREQSEPEQKLKGLYGGQSSRATARPTSEMMLRAFKGIHLLRVDRAGQHTAWMTPLTPLQERILILLGFSSELYQRLTDHFHKLAPNLSET